MKRIISAVILIMICIAVLTGCGKPSFVGTYEGPCDYMGNGGGEVVMVIEKDGSIYREEHFKEFGIAHIDVWGTGTEAEDEAPKKVAKPYYGTWRKITDDEIIATFNDELQIEPLTITLSSDGKMIIVESQVPYYMTYNYTEYLDRTNTKVQKLRERKVIGESTEKPESQTKNIFGKPVEPDGIDEIDLSNYSGIKYRIVEENPSQEVIDNTIKKLTKRAKAYDGKSIVRQEEAGVISIYIPKTEYSIEILKEIGKPGELRFMDYMYDDNDQMIDLKDVLIDGTNIKTARYEKRSGSESNEEYEVRVVFTEEGARLFEDVTLKNVGKQIAIIYNDEIISAPVVREPITGGECSLAVSFTYVEAVGIAAAIKTGALPLHLEEVEYINVN